MAHVKTTKVSKERQEELLGMKLQMAFSELEDEEIAACLQEGLNPKEEIIEAADSAMERIENRLGKAVRQGRREQVFARSFLLAGKRLAACLMIVCVCISGLAVAAAAVPSIRTAIGKLFIDEYNHQKGHVDMFMTPEKSIPVPEEWEGLYYFSYMPERYECREVYSGCVKYGVDNGYVMFEECDKDSVTVKSTEEFEISDGKINGHKAIIFEKNGEFIIAWANDIRYFWLQTNESLEIGLKIAEGIVPIR